MSYLMKLMASTAITCTIPKLVNTIESFFISFREKPELRLEIQTPLAIDEPEELIADPDLPGWTNAPRPLNDPIKPAKLNLGIPTPLPAFRKKRDTTKLTIAHYHYIKRAHTKMVAMNKVCLRIQRRTTADLAVELNDEFKLNKSLTFYSEIWNDHTEAILHRFSSSFPPITFTHKNK